MFFRNNKKYNILVLGNNGMLGYELYNMLLKVSSFKYHNIGTVVGIDIKDGIDLSSRGALDDYFKKSIHFDYCINCVASTDTKSAETTKEGREIDYILNVLAPKYIAESCKIFGTKLIHISTDYVFSEKSIDVYGKSDTMPSPFRTYSETFPINVYGYDKLLGEKFIEEVFGKNSKDYCICRVSWIYGMHNNKSFIHKFLKNIIKLANEGKTECEMTSNENSVPTSCEYVVNMIMEIITNKTHGIYHAVPKCDDVGVSRLEFAKEILKYFQGVEINGIDISKFNLKPVERDSYWPKYSVMRSSNDTATQWTYLLDRFLANNSVELMNWTKTN